MVAAGQLLMQDLHIVVGAEAQASFIREGQAGWVERQRLSELRSEAVAPHPSRNNWQAAKAAASGMRQPAQPAQPKQAPTTGQRRQATLAARVIGRSKKTQGGTHQLHCADNLTRRVVGADGVRHVAASAVCAAGGRPQVRRHAGTRRSAASACTR